jgi:hypothetical protein
MTALARIAALAGACSLLWVIEGRRPFMGFGEHRHRHVRPNLVLAGLTILTNVAFAAALRPLRASLGVAAASASAPVNTAAAAYLTILFMWLPFRARFRAIPGQPTSAQRGSWEQRSCNHDRRKIIHDYLVANIREPDHTDITKCDFCHPISPSPRQELH